MKSDNCCLLSRQDDERYKNQDSSQHTVGTGGGTLHGRHRQGGEGENGVHTQHKTKQVRFHW